MWTNHLYRCDDLIAQNGILHNHLETVSTQAARIQTNSQGETVDVDADVPAPPTDAKSAEELHAVIRYVRRERDVAELRLELSRQQEVRMRQQLEQANRQLDEKSMELLQERQKSAESMSAASQHAELVEKVQALNLLRESNETLRRESEKYLQRATSLEQRLSEADAQLSPLREQVRVFQAEMDARDRNIKLLEDDNARWKNRTQQILQKYERIDPAELAQLKEELEAVKTSLEQAQKERDAALSRVTAVSTDLNDANTRVRCYLLFLELSLTTP
jgi:nucleoprotein TPR